MSDKEPLTRLPQVLSSVSAVRRLTDDLATLKFCPGNEDEKYLVLQEARKGVFKDATGKIAVLSVLIIIIVLILWLGSNVVASYVKDYFTFHTIRCASCQIVLASSSQRCGPCSEYRRVLNAMLSRRAKQNPENSVLAESHTNLRFLNTPQRKERFSRLKLKSKLCQQQLRRLEEKIERLVEARGIEVSEDLHSDLAAMVEENSSEVEVMNPPNSFKRIFWQQQQRAASLKDSRSMKWEPAMIR